MTRLLVLNFLLVLIWVPKYGISQDSFSVILEIDSANINPNYFISSRGKYYVSTLYFDTQFIGRASIIEFNPIKNEQKNFTLDSLDFGPEPFFQFDDTSLYMYGKDRSIPLDLRYQKLMRNGSVSNKRQIETPGWVNYSLSNHVYKDHAFLAFNIRTENDSNRYSGISKINKNGDLQWKRYYFEEEPYSYLERIYQCDDTSFLASAAVSKKDIGSTSRRALLMKLDTSGNILWEYIPDEPMSGGAVPPWFAVLSDSTIVMNYSINKDWDDPEDWNRILYKFVWIDQNGQFIRERYIPHHWKVDAYIADVKGGKQGDYFFTFGRERDIRDPYQSQAVLTKYNNAGDTIWHRSYAHPDFPNEDFQYSMVEMEEQDDGSFVLLAKISTARDYNKAWLFTVDSMGCFYTDSCGERLIVSSPTVVLPQNRIRASLFPNPARNQLTIQSSAPFDQLVFYNMAGEEIFVQKMTRTDQYTIHTGDLRPGMYIVHLRHQGQILERLKFVKI